jgi:hypothetical protein
MNTNTLTDTVTTAGLAESSMIGTFIIAWDGGAPETANVMRFADRADADRYEDELAPEGRLCSVIDSAEDIRTGAAWKTSILVAVINAVRDPATPPVNKLESVAAGSKRLHKLLVTRYGDLPLTELPAPAEAVTLVEPPVEQVVETEPTVEAEQVVVPTVEAEPVVELIEATTAKQETLTTESVADGVFMLAWNGAGPSEARVMRFANRADAEHYEYEHVPGDQRCSIIEIEEDIRVNAVWNVPVIHAVLNAIREFTSIPYSEPNNIAIGSEALYKLLVARYNTIPLTVPPIPEEPIKTATPATGGTRKESKMSDAATTTGTRGKKSPIPEDHIVTVLVKDNPKRPGTGNYERWDAMLKVIDRHHKCTVAAARKAGVTLGDLVFNAKKDYIKIDAPA